MIIVNTLAAFEWLSMPHRRSIASLARRFVLAMSFRDREKAESISRTSKHEIKEYLRKSPDLWETEKGIQEHMIPDVEKGLVLSDSRGRGSFQR